MNFVTDTHALLWWFTDNPKISQKASSIFEKCEKGENVIFVPSIVIAEALSIFEKNASLLTLRNCLKKYMIAKILCSLHSITPFSKK